MSANSEELPEHQIFHILKAGEQESIGPFSQKQLLELLKKKEISHSDLVYYPQLADWTPLSEVFDFHQGMANFSDDGQDPEIVAQSFAFIDNRSEPDEEIYYIAVQNFPALSLTASVKLRSPRSVVLTSWRFCVIKPKLMGNTDFDEFMLDQIESVESSYDPAARDGTFTIRPRFDDDEEVDQIPVQQLKRLETIAAELLSNDEK